MSSTLTENPSFVTWMRDHSSCSSVSHARDAGSAQLHGVREAFDEWGISVWRSLRLRGVRERDLDDVLQDVFVIALTRWDTFRRDSTRRAWLYGIAHRVVANYHRKNRKPGAEPALTTGEAWDKIVSDQPDPCAYCCQREALELLRHLLAASRQQDQTLFILVRIDGFSVSEASQMVGLTVSRATTRLAAIDKQLTRALERHQARDEWRLR